MNLVKHSDTSYSVIQSVIPDEMRQQLIQVLVPGQGEDHGSIVTSGVKTLELFVFVDMMVDQETGSDVGGMIWLKLKTIPIKEKMKTFKYKS